MPVSKDVDLNELAAITHGYTGADLSALVKEAAMVSLRNIWPKIIDKKKIPEEMLMSLTVTMDNFTEALKSIRPSALREVFVERPNVHWSDIGDMEKIKEEIKEAVELPLKNPELFERTGIRPIKGILLVGPTGHGQDDAREGRRHREGGELHIDKGARGAQQVRRARARRR